MATVEAPHHYKFNIKMNCSGCSGAVDRVLKKTEGLQYLSSEHPAFTARAPVSYLQVANQGSQVSRTTKFPLKTKQQTSMQKKTCRTRPC